MGYCFERVLTEVIITYLVRIDEFQISHYYAQNVVREAMLTFVTPQPLALFHQAFFGFQFLNSCLSHPHGGLIADSCIASKLC